MAAGLLRVTAVGGTRSVDLAVPGEVPVVELVPDLARAVGLLDPAAAYAGYRLHSRGRPLRSDEGLCAQGVGDGALLALSAGADLAVPAPHDDIAEAVAEVVRQRPQWRRDSSVRTAWASGLVAVALGLCGAGWELVPRPTAGWTFPGLADWLPLAAAVVLVLGTLAGNALASATVVLGAGRADDVPAPPGRVEAMVARCSKTLLVGSAALGLVVASTVPLVAVDAAGAALAGDCCLVLLLRARRHRSSAQVLVDVLGGLLALLTTLVVLLVHQPGDRTALAAAVAVCGATTCLLARVPVPSLVLRARALDVVETVALVALAPLLLWAADGPGRVMGG